MSKRQTLERSDSLNHESVNHGETTTVQVNRNLLYEAVNVYNASKSEIEYLRPYSQRDIVHIALVQLVERIKKEAEGLAKKKTLS